ncbi:MAG: DUF4384 domain-containing protein [Candidatus Tectomicrobia bacterium]|nr:DUF4384 domain-containing protein [Candidatus Tectomicrobia bacterium]
MKRIAERRVPPAALRRRLGAAWRRYGQVACVLLTAVLAGCTGPSMPAPPGLTAAPGSSVVYNAEAPFSVGVIPTQAPPVRIGDKLGFRLNSSASGYGHLYLLTASGDVLVLTQNLPLAAGADAVYPDPDAGVVLRASPPAGVERLLFLVTLQPFEGFGRESAPDRPLQLAVRAEAFIRNFNAATKQLPDSGWAVTENRVETVAAANY